MVLKVHIRPTQRLLCAPNKSFPIENFRSLPQTKLARHHLLSINKNIFQGVFYNEFGVISTPFSSPTVMSNDNSASVKFLYRRDVYI